MALLCPCRCAVTAHNLPQWMWIRKLKSYKVQLSHPHMPHTGSADRHLGTTSRSRSIAHQIDGRGSRSAGSSRGSFPRFASDTSAGESFLPEESVRGGSFAAAAAVAVAVVDSKRQAEREGGFEHEDSSLVPPQYSSEPAEDAAGDGEEEVDEGLMWGWEEEEEEPVSGLRCFFCIPALHPGLRRCDPSRHIGFSIRAHAR